MMQISDGMFPFQQGDLRYFILKRKDGTVIKTVITGDVKEAGAQTKTAVKVYTHGQSLSDFCNHNPKLVYESPKFKLSISGATGARGNKSNFDLVIDVGDIFWPTMWRKDLILTGNSYLVDDMEEFVSGLDNTRTEFFQIDWKDRQAPPLKPEFWPALAAKLEGNVLTSCQGGHGRSGTTCVCLLMASIPDYSALDAILHVRAVHCPRAIESQGQHSYINAVAALLGREANADDAEKVTNYKEAFLKVKSEQAKRWQKGLGG